jgi:hypothetical protein
VSGTVSEGLHCTALGSSIIFTVTGGYVFIMANFQQMAVKYLKEGKCDRLKTQLGYFSVLPIRRQSQFPLPSPGLAW